MEKNEGPSNLGRAYAFIAGVVLIVAAAVSEVHQGGFLLAGILLLIGSVFGPWGDL